MKIDLPILQAQDAINRRTFLTRSAAGMGMAALGSLMARAANLASAAASGKLPAVQAAHDPLAGLPNFPQFAPKAKRVIYLFMGGAHRDYPSSALRRYQAEDRPFACQARGRLCSRW